MGSETLPVKIGVIEANIKAIQEQLKTVEHKLSLIPDPEVDIKLIKSDLDLIKKIVYGIVGLVLVAFAGQIINQTSEYQKLRTIIERIDNAQTRPNR